MSTVQVLPAKIADGKITLSSKCLLCGKVNTLTLDYTPEMMTAINRFYSSGALVQDCFPTLNADQREFFLTGNCSCIWG